MKTHPVLPLVLVFAALACDKEPSKTDPTPKNAAPAASATTTTNAAPASSDVTAAAGTALAAGANGALPLSWKITNAPNEMVSVSLVAGDQTIALGTLAAASDDGPGTVDTCSMKNTGTGESRLSCGMTPHYNWYTAKIAGGALVVSLTDGVDQDPGSEKVKEVARRPTTATSLEASGPASKALYGECRPGYVQKGPGQPCMHQCLKGTGCKATEKCELTAVEGTDGPHRVSACVPK
jgi:hypothetical protein